MGDAAGLDDIYKQPQVDEINCCEIGALRSISFAWTTMILVTWHRERLGVKPTEAGRTLAQH